MTKRAYPWRLGTTSFILPATVEENVCFLAPQVDDVQLLFFESASRARLPHQVDIGLLSRLSDAYGLSYTVHLPTDLALASVDEKRRQQDVAEICRLVEELAPLNPLAFDLHLNRDQEMAEESWLACLQLSLAELGQRLGPWQQRLCIENIGYDLPPEVVALVRQTGANLCLDLGHLRHYGHEGPGLEEECGHVHLHGVVDGKDHQALVDEPWLEGVLRQLLEADYRQVVTLEVYRKEGLARSLQALALAWSRLCGS